MFLGNSVFLKNLTLLAEKNQKLALEIQISRRVPNVTKEKAKLSIKKDVETAILYDLLSYDFKDLLTAFSKDKTLLIYAFCSLDDDLRGIFSEEGLTELIQNERFFLLKRPCNEWELIAFARRVFLKKIQILGEESEESKIFQEELSGCIEKTLLCFSDYRDFGKRVFTNVIENTKYLSKSYDASSMYNTFKGVPAIVCGAGSSLNKHRDALESLNSKALIFAGGSSIASLTGMNLTFHIGGVVDPCIPIHKFDGLKPYKQPFFYKLRSDPFIHSYFQGKKFLSPSSSGYLLEEYLYENCTLKNIQEDTGFTVGNYLAFLAASLGCNPVVLVGMDGGVVEGCEYAGGVVGKSFAANPIRKKSMRGNVVFTRKDLLASHDFFSSLPSVFPNVKFINSTFDGLSINFLEHKELVCVFKDREELDIEKILNNALHKAKPLSFHREIFLKDLSKSMSKSHQYIDKILLELSKEGQANHGLLALYEIELEEELAHLKILDPLYHVFKYAIHKDDSQNESLQKMLFFKRCLKSLSPVCANIC